MKKFISCSIFLFYFFIVFSQNSNVKLFWVFRYLQSEVYDYYVNMERRDLGLSFSYPIDFTKQIAIFNVSADSLLQAVEQWDVFNKADIYFLPIEFNKFYFENFCADLISNLEFFSPKDSCSYYSAKNEKFLYKIFYVEGHQKILKLENNQYNRAYLDVYEAIDPNLEFFYAHFIYKITKFDCNLEIKGFQKWSFER